MDKGGFQQIWDGIVLQVAEAYGMSSSGYTCPRQMAEQLPVSTDMSNIPYGALVIVGGWVSPPSSWTGR